MLTRAAISGDSFPSVSQHHLTVTTEQKLALENYPLVTRSCAGALQGGNFQNSNENCLHVNLQDGPAGQMSVWYLFSASLCVIVCHHWAAATLLYPRSKWWCHCWWRCHCWGKSGIFSLASPPRPSPCHHYDESLIKVRSLRPATKARPLHQETITTMRFHISHRSHPGSQVPLSPMAVGEPD